MSIFQLSTYYDSNGLTYPGEQALRAGGVLGGLALLVAAAVTFYFLFTDFESVGAILGGAFGGDMALVSGLFAIIFSIMVDGKKRDGEQNKEPARAPDTQPKGITETDDL